MNAARILSERQLLAIASDPKHEKNWLVQSLLVTLEHEKASAAERESLLKVQIANTQAHLRWFEDTYNTRAMGPLAAKRFRGEPCPKCGQPGVVKLGPLRACFECQQEWEG